MFARAVVLNQPGQISLSDLALTDPSDADVVVDVLWSGISSGTERLLWSGRMPAFPGMGYPLVPGYETVGVVSQAGFDSGRQVGETVFVPGARCYGAVRGLFGGAASKLVSPGSRVTPINPDLAQDGALMALAATAVHARSKVQTGQRELIIGHGVLGRLLARLAVASGIDPIVWETDPRRQQGAVGYTVVDPAEDDFTSYQVITDVSGDPDILDRAIVRLAAGGELVLAGFYDRPLSFSFAPAFMREARIQVSAEWKPNDLTVVSRLIEDGSLSLKNLITHQHDARDAARAYRTAFEDRSCLKMILDWRNVQ
jgi:3-hydroxyethyl bacteriochlorophyllide a dehydrogenase